MRIHVQVGQIPNILPQTNTLHQHESEARCDRLSEFRFGLRHEEVVLAHLWGRHPGCSRIRMLDPSNPNPENNQHLIKDGPR